MNGEIAMCTRTMTQRVQRFFTPFVEPIPDYFEGLVRYDIQNLGTILMK